MSRTVKEWKNFCPDAACLLKDWNVYVKMGNCTEEPCLWGGTVQLLHQNYIICSLYTEDCYPPTPVPSPYRKMKARRKTGQDTEAALAGLSPRLNPTNCPVLPADAAGEEITSTKIAEKALQSHCLQACPESNVTSKQQWIDLQKFSTLISCHVNLRNRNMSSCNRSSRMPTNH